MNLLFMFGSFDYFTFQSQNGVILNTFSFDC